MGQEGREEMKMEVKTGVVVVGVVLVMASCAAAQVIVNAPKPPPPPIGVIGTPLFTGCAGKSGRDLFGCYQSNFEPYINARNTQQSKCYVDGKYSPDAAPCPDCPSSPECSALGGLCLPTTNSAGEPSNFNPVSEVVDDCPTGSTCVNKKGKSECTDPNSTSDKTQCSCEDAGGYILGMSECRAQCGTYTAYKKPDSGLLPPPSGGVGLPAPTVCCKPAGECKDFHTKSCFDGSACYYGECTPDGKFTCPSGTGSPVENAGHPVCDD